MSEQPPIAEKDAATLTDKEIELREWLRSQPGGAERWTIIKAGFRRSYDMGLRTAQASVAPPAGGPLVEYEWGVTQGDEPVRTLHEEGARSVARRQPEGHPRRRLMRRTLGPWVEVPQVPNA